MVVTMQSLRVGRRPTAVLSLAIFCLSSSPYCLVRSERPNPFPLEGRGTLPGADVETKKCDNAGSGVSVTLEGEGAVFQFECPKNSKLEPVEQVLPSKAVLTGDELKKVSIFEPPSRAAAGACTESPQKLDDLVPKSTLEEVKLSEDQVLEEEAQTRGRVFKLTLGSAPVEARHLCYTCVTPAGDNLQKAGTKCNVYVTVPAKVNPQPVPPVGDEADRPSGSGSFSLSVSCWLIVGVTGCVTAMMMTHL